MLAIYSPILDGMVRLILINIRGLSMRKWFLPLIVILSMLVPFGVHAQDPITLSSLEIQIWPEYDQPSVLVIYQMTLSSSTTFPATVSVRIPLAAGEPYAVAIRQLDGELYNIDYTRQVSGDWAAINFSTTAPEVQLEYYDPGLTKEGNTRHYQYVWPGEFAISQLTIQVQQPASATDMHISPSLGEGVVAGDNLTYYTQNIGAIPAGQNINITIDYQKSADSLSTENLLVEPSAPIPQSTVPDLNFSAWLPWILGIVGAGLIIGGIIWFWQTGRQRPVSHTHRGRSRAGSREADAPASSSEDSVYCSNCGKRALPGDQYCRSCGTALRTR
jgi:hypothetical protein